GRSTFDLPMAETSTAVIASANNLCVKYGAQVVLDGATIAFTEGEHIGLVGRNGSGKSTFLQIAAGVAQADSGEFTRRRDLVTGYMPQLSGLDDAATVHANILSGARRIFDLISEYEPAPGDSPLSASLLDQIGEADGWNLEHRIKSLITNLHAPEFDRVVGTLSGGEKRRVALCRALLARPDFDSRRTDQPSRHRLDRMAGGLSRALCRHLFVRHARSLFSRSGRDADRRAVARPVHQLRRQLHGLPARARATPGGRGGAGTSTAKVFETRTAMGEKSATRAPDEIGGSR